MTILYSLVARGGFVLAEYVNPAYSGNFSAVSVLLNRIESEGKSEDRNSFTFESNNGSDEPQTLAFHYIKSDMLTYLVLCTIEFQRSEAFDFLNSMKQQFIHNYGTRGYTASAYEFNADFKHIMQRLATQTSDAHLQRLNNDSLHRARKQANEVHQILISNIEDVIARGDKIEDLYVRVDNLHEHASLMQTKARGVRQRFKCEYWRMKIIIFFVIVAVIYVALTAGCGGFDWPKCT